MGKLTYNCAGLPEQTAHREVTMVGEEQWEEIHRLFTLKKWSKSAVARELNLDVKTARRCLRRAAWVPYQRAPRPETLLTAHAELVHRRAPEVGYSARILFQELVHQHGYRVLFTTAAALISALTRATAEGRLEEKLKAYTVPRLLILDEIGYLPVDRVGATLFFQLVSRRYERGPVILTFNQSFANWGDIFGDRIIATAILDRLLHHGITVSIRGDSYRLKEKIKAGLLKGTEAMA